MKKLKVFLSVLLVVLLLQSGYSERYYMTEEQKKELEEIFLTQEQTIEELRTLQSESENALKDCQKNLQMAEESLRKSQRSELKNKILIGIGGIVVGCIIGYKVKF